MASVGASLFSSRPALCWEFAALTDVGRVRAHNEDAVHVDPALGLAVLADGMGGYKGGEVASAMAVSLVHGSFGRWFAQAAGHQAPARVVRRALQAAADEANASILHAGRTREELQGMGTTLVLAAFQPQRVLVGHIGDSRCYRVRNNKLELLTRDHSLRQQQLDAGAITAEEALNSPTRNLVTRAVGVEAQVLLEMHEHSARPGDLYMLCSDGLSEMITDAQLFTLLGHDVGLQKKVQLLVAIANDNGGRDNISVVLAKADVGDTSRMAR
ncbi:serine/threonine protein phosphatase PrpC [Variovorax boronicumulans]|uniref:Stp1/IreP family PP2C-type Ser/Thr phosphatase n=1 Tax=Variovorax boronicumulans TaxID=436515 RepID=UPI002473306C|nr:Stp1/IreP family PP2C-type Ser/Thr phosphatase [Variovorax boronicumulans]MDH6167257.1 serine/threonine protein phosphatase PrpC [Variovorax boronicumulans]